MFCPACGGPVVAGVQFCTSCGAKVAVSQPVYAAYPPPGAMRMRAPRVQRNLQLLGILWCVFAAYRVVGGLIGMFFLRTFAIHRFGMGWPPGGNFGARFGQGWMGALIPFVAVYTVFAAVLALVVGYSLLTRRPWGRTLAIVVGILTLLKPIMGTALGIYTLWVLAPAASGDEYEALVLS